MNSDKAISLLLGVGFLASLYVATVSGIQYAAQADDLHMLGSLKDSFKPTADTDSFENIHSVLMSIAEGRAMQLRNTAIFAAGTTFLFGLAHYLHSIRTHKASTQ